MGRSYQALLDGDRYQSEMDDKRIEVVIAVQKRVPVFDAPRSNEGVDCLADRHAASSEGAVIVRGLDSDVPAGDFDHG